MKYFRGPASQSSFAMPSLPREIFDMMLNFVKPNPFQSKAMADSFFFDENNTSSRLWRSIFRDEAWFKTAADVGAEPVLIGANLDDVVAYQSGKKKSAYIILCANDSHGRLYDNGMDYLRKSLRSDGRYNKARCEVILPAREWKEENIKLPKIILNVRDIVEGREILYLEGEKTRELNGNGLLETKFCFLTDSKIQSLNSRDIMGIGGPISKNGSLTPVCTMNLRGKTRKWQVSIHEPVDNLRLSPGQALIPMYEGGRSYVPHGISAWKYRSQRVA